MHKILTPEDGVRSRKAFFEVIRYGIAGLTNTAVSLILYVTCIIVFFAPFWLANSAAFVGGLVCGYCLSKTFVFKSNDAQARQSVPRYFLVIMLQFVISTMMIGGLVFLGFGEIIAYFIVLPVAIAMSFILQKVWVFKSIEPTFKA